MSYLIADILHESPLQSTCMALAVFTDYAEASTEFDRHIAGRATVRLGIYRWEKHILPGQVVDIPADARITACYQ